MKCSKEKGQYNESLNECTRIITEHRNPGKVMHFTNKTGEQNMEVTKRALLQCEG